MTPPRVAIVGARRVRQGLGPFVARDLVAAGARIAGFVARGAASLGATRDALAAVGVEARGHLDLASLIAAERPDALAILSPAETHGVWLEAALRARLHVFCEKPLLWGEPEPAAHARRLASAFDEAGLVLHENCQWPFTLASFEALHPRGLSEPRAFAMRLQPASRGRQMIGDAMPHPLSLLQAIAPGDDARLERVRFSSRETDADRLEVSFDWVAGERRVASQVHLERSDRIPREAGYAVNGREVQRVVHPPSYRICFASEGREIVVPDPLAAAVAAFAAAISVPASARPPSRSPEIAQRMALLERLLRAFDLEG